MGWSGLGGAGWECGTRLALGYFEGWCTKFLGRIGNPTRNIRSLPPGRLSVPAPPESATLPNGNRVRNSVKLDTPIPPLRVFVLKVAPTPLPLRRLKIEANFVAYRTILLNYLN